jgi:hypothetical protein
MHPTPKFGGIAVATIWKHLWTDDECPGAQVLRRRNAEPCPGRHAEGFDPLGKGGRLGQAADTASATWSWSWRSREMTLTQLFPPELIRVPRKVVWYDILENTLADLPTFLAHVIVYGSPADVALVERFVPAEEFRRVLENAPAGSFTSDSECRYRLYRAAAFLMVR